MQTQTRFSEISPPTWIAIAVSVVGALNWGLVGLFDFNLVAAIFGNQTTASRTLYVIVAAAGVYLLVSMLNASRPAPAIAGSAAYRQPDARPPASERL